MRRFSTAIVAGAAALALSATAAQAQTIGFKLGASMSKFSFDLDGETEEFDYLTSFAGGGFVRFGFGRLGIQPEILTVTKGAEIDGGEGGEDESIKVEYIEVPVLLHFPLTYGSSFAPYVFGGPAFAFDIGCEMEFAGEEVDCEDESLDESIFARKSIDIGLSAGGGLAFAMGPGALLVEGRYTWGLTNINDNEGADQSKVKNRSILLLAGYSIPLGRGY